MRDNTSVEAAEKDCLHIAREKGTNSKEALDARVRLAFAYSEGGKRKEALSLMDEVYERKCELFGKESPSAVRTFCARLLLSDINDEEGFIDKLKEASKQLDLIINIDDSDVPSALHSYAQACEKFYDTPSIDVYERICKWTEEFKGTGSKEHIFALGELADVYYYLELDEEAIEVGTRIYSYSKDTYGEENEYTVMVCENLAKLYYFCGETDESIKLLDLVLGVYESLGAQTVKKVEAYYNSALCAWRKKDTETADQKLTKAHELCLTDGLENTLLRQNVEKLLRALQSGTGSIFLTLRWSNLFGVMS